jgi:hypothetical protein
MKFYKTAVGKVPKSDIVITLGDLNAKLRRMSV